MYYNCFSVIFYPLAHYHLQGNATHFSPRFVELPLSFIYLVCNINLVILSLSCTILRDLPFR